MVVPLGAPPAMAAENRSVPPGSVTTQSSTYQSTALASRAVDGNVSGHWSVGSVSSTNEDHEAWWQVDMQESIQVDRVRIWNRTDCCPERLADFYLFVSDQPFATNDVATTLTDANVTSRFHAGPADKYVTFEPGVTGRYVRIQLTGTNFLSLAEVQVNPTGFTPLADQTWGVANRTRSVTSATEAEVFAIEQIGNTIYVGGKFHNPVRRRVVDPQVDQPYLAAFDATTGDFVAHWRPRLNGPVRALESSADGSRLYVGGEFTEVNGHPDTRGIVALDPESGLVDHTWFAAVDNAFTDDPATVNAIEESEGFLYIAGSFSHAEGKSPLSRRFVYKVARLSTVTGAPDTSWLPKVTGGAVAGGSVRGLSHDPVRNRVYLVGYFESVNGSADTARYAAVSDVDGSTTTGLQRFPVLHPQDHHFQVIAHGDFVWIAGTQHVVYMLNADDLSINRRWFTGFRSGFHGGGDFQALGIVGDKMYATCHCWGVISELPDSVTTLSEAKATPIVAEVRSVIGFDLETGDLDSSWLPDTFGSIGGWAIHGAPDGCMWIGGDFNRRQIGDQWRNSLQRYCPSPGQGPAVGPPLANPSKPETNPPSTPTGFSATDAGDSTVDLSWSPSTDDTAVVYYRVYRNGAYLQATRSLALTDLAATPGDTYTVRAVDAYETESADSAAATPLLAGLTEHLLNASFDGSREGFVYRDDAFNATSAPSYADGLVHRHGGSPAGQLMVFLGGYDHSNVYGMSGAWERNFTLDEPSSVEISFEYRLKVSVDNDAGEYGQAMVAVNGGTPTVVASIAGGGDSDWQVHRFSVDLPAGTHTLSLGGFHNQKTTRTESVEVSFDSVRVAPHTPAVGFTEPQPGSAVADTVTFELRATDLTTPTSELTVAASTDGGASWQPAVWDAASGRFEYTLDTTTLAEGPLELMARVTDATGDVTVVAATFEVDNDVAPTVAVTAPAEGATVTTAATVVVAASDREDDAGTLTVEVSTDGTRWNPATWNGVEQRYEYEWVLGSTEGPIELLARATDSAGAVTVSDAVTVQAARVPNFDYGDYVIDDGASVVWRLDESAGTTAYDSAGDNDAAFVGAPALGSSSLLVSENTSVEFDGSDDMVEIPNSPEINQGGPYSTKTIELWFRANEVESRQVLLEQGSIVRGLNLYVEDGKLYAGAYNTSTNGGNPGWGPVWMSTPIVAGTTYHAVFVIDSPANELRLYVNGEQAAEANGVGELYNHGRSAIGGQRDWARYHTGAQPGEINYFAGRIDEVAIYPTALDADTARRHHALGMATLTEPTISIESPSEGATVQGVTQVVIDAADPDDTIGSLDVEIRVGAEAWQLAQWSPESSRYEYVWDPAQLAAGSTQIRARVTDRNGTTVEAAPVTVTVAVASRGYRRTVLDDGATVYWRLGESSGTTANDVLGVNDATYVGSPDLGLPGIINRANASVAFDGVDDRINIANSTEINQGGPYLTKTIELWFNADSVNPRQVLLEQGSVSRGLNIFVGGGKIRAGAYNTADQGGNTPWGPVWLESPISAGTDYHVVLVLDAPNGELRLYLNGELVDSAGGVGELHNHGLSAIGGQRGWARYHTGAQKGDRNYFAGRIDEVAVYADALDAATIADHFAVGSS